MLGLGLIATHPIASVIGVKTILKVKRAHKYAR